MALKFLDIFKAKAAGKQMSSEQIDVLLLARSLLDRHPDQAAAAYRSILAAYPDHWESLNAVAAIALRNGEFEKAVQAYSAVIQRRSDYAEGYYKRANAHNGLGRWEAALADYDDAIALDRKYANAYCNRGAVLERLARWDEALTSYDRAISLDPEDFLSHYNRGSVLKELKRFDEGLASYDRAIALKPDYAEAYVNRGNVLRQLQRYQPAIASYDRAIELAPGLALPYLAHSSRGLALAGLKRFSEAVAAFDAAIDLKNDYFEAFYARGHVLQAMRQYDAAVESYDHAIALDPHDRRAHPAYCSRGFALKELKRFQDALASYDQAIALEDSDAEVCTNRAGVLQELGQHEAAIASYDRAIVLNPECVEAHAGRGFALLNCGRHEAALGSFDRAFALQPEMKYLSAFRRYAQMQTCDWRDLAPYLEQLERRLMKREPVSGPFQVLALLDSPPLQRLAAEIWVREECPPNEVLGAIAARPLADKIRIGYFSADFYNHAVSFLTAGLFETHDRSRFEVIAFALGPKVNDAVRARLERAFDNFIDVGERSDVEVAETARRLGIDIAVDLGGFTTHARPKIFALRAAPIQMSYIGYLGTLGAPYMDYLLADHTLIPDEERQHYSEAIIYLPSYQVNDSTRAVVERTLARAELGLPAKGFVFSCFNANYKLLPATFASWMRILKRVPGSSLFLYVGAEVAEVNLRKEAESCGVDPRRLIFGQFLLLEEHMARLRSMDLFLDTLPYNAGTTASDALWAGLPVLTCAGRAFASRIAASLLNAIELPELVTSTTEEYEEMAVQLAENPELLQKIKLKLAHNRLKTALFDTRLFTKHLELAYTRVQERHRAGLAPETTFVTLNR